MSHGTLILVRHGQSTWNATGRWQGQADPPLSPLGMRQAQALAEALAIRGFVHLATSDLERARETAAAVTARVGIEAEAMPDLRELDVGSWSGLTRAQIVEAQGADALERYFRGDVGWTGGETYEQHDERCARAARRLEEDVRRHGTVVAVSHGGTIRGILLALLEFDPGARWRLAGIGHGSTATLIRTPHGWRLAEYNVRPSV